jgi:hypothetical protein
MRIGCENAMDMSCGTSAERPIEALYSISTDARESAKRERAVALLQRDDGALSVHAHRGPTRCRTSSRSG